MKAPRSLLTSAAFAALVLSLAGCSTVPQDVASPGASTGDDMSVLAVESACEGEEGVTVIVDASALADAEDLSRTWCALTDEPIAASDALERANIATEGTDEYGDQVVCRVNGVPAEDVAIPAEDGSDYFETCASMPAAFAYWSLWVKPGGAEWAYAEEGLSTLQLDPGESIELLFTLNGEPAAPAS